MYAPPDVCVGVSVGSVNAFSTMNLKSKIYIARIHLFLFISFLFFHTLVPPITVIPFIIFHRKVFTVHFYFSTSAAFGAGKLLLLSMIINSCKLFIVYC